MSKIKVNFVCKIKLVTDKDQVLEDQYNGSFSLEEGYETDFGGEDVLLMPEVLREAMYQINDLRNNKAGLQNSKSLDFSISDYSIEYEESEVD